MTDPNMSDLEHAFWEGKAEAWEEHKATTQQNQELRALLKECLEQFHLIIETEGDTWPLKQRIDALLGEGNDG